MSALSPDPKTPKPAHVQLGAAGVSVVFLLVGVAGFIPGITTRYMDMEVAGNGSDAQLLGLFRVSVLHNVVHLAFGVVGLAFSRTPRKAVNFLLYGGFVYAALFFYGIVIDYQSKANFVPFDDADNVLHFALAAMMITMSIVLDRGPSWSALIEQGRARV